MTLQHPVNVTQDTAMHKALMTFKNVIFLRYLIDSFVVSRVLICN